MKKFIIAFTLGALSLTGYVGSSHAGNKFGNDGTRSAEWGAGISKPPAYSSSTKYRRGYIGKHKGGEVSHRSIVAPQFRGGKRRSYRRHRSWRR